MSVKDLTRYKADLKEHPMGLQVCMKVCKGKNSYVKYDEAVKAEEKSLKDLKDDILQKEKQNERYIVFESLGKGDVDQVSIPLKLDECVRFYLSSQKMYNHRDYFICKELSKKEVDEVIERLEKEDKVGEILVNKILR